MNQKDVNLLRACKLNETATLSDGSTYMRVLDDDDNLNEVVSDCFRCAFFTLNDYCPDVGCYTAPPTHFIDVTGQQN